MMGSKEIPKRSDLVDYNYAVAGHAGTLCDPDGELFIKPCTQQEIDFYHAANAEHRDLSDIMPCFMGTLLLNDATDMMSINEQLPVVSDHLSTEMKEQVIRMAHQLEPSPSPSPQVEPADNIKWIPNKSKKIATDTAIVLENAAYGFKRPNILDVKLGRRLWADDAPLEKKKRFDQITEETTHGSLGFRIAGMRVYRGSDNPKDLDEEDYRIYNKDFGRVTVNKDNVLDAFKSFIFNEAAGIDEDLGKIVAGVFMEQVKHVQHVLEGKESRMYSSSLLFVFEGDGPTLRAAVDEAKARAHLHQQHIHEVAAGRSTSRVDSGIVMDDNFEMVPAEKMVALPENGLTGHADDMFDEGWGSEASSEEADQPHILAVKLIDFAHADFTPGQGPDENNLMGVRSLVRIFGELSR